MKRKGYIYIYIYIYIERERERERERDCKAMLCEYDEDEMSGGNNNKPSTLRVVTSCKSTSTKNIEATSQLPAEVRM